LVPVSPKLLKSIECLDQAQYMCASFHGLVSQRVLHVQHLIGSENPIEVGTFGVNLVQLKAKLIGHGDDHP
jgi:hypothetical protein